MKENISKTVIIRRNGENYAGYLKKGKLSVPNVIGQDNSEISFDNKTYYVTKTEVKYIEGFSYPKFILTLGKEKI
tara:strand:- start:409 stop:633 length:225 start_codon:yes stop_codon:yes gene_type:complete